MQSSSHQCAVSMRHGCYLLKTERKKITVIEMRFLRGVVNAKERDIIRHYVIRTKLRLTPVSAYSQK